MKRVIMSSMLLVLSSSVFAAAVTCTVTNARTGQVFNANGGGPNEERATQVAQDKALGKCHEESKGWPGQCMVSKCTPT